jgi:hypothetical protein
LESGTSYFTFDTDLDWLLGEARRHANQGRDVLVLTRRPRRWLQRRHDLEGIDTVHFRVDKTMQGVDTLSPENVGRIFTRINGFNFFIKLLYTINDVVWASGGRVVFLIDPTAFHRRELHIIQKELVELRNPQSRVGIEHAVEE